MPNLAEIRAEKIFAKFRSTRIQPKWADPAVFDAKFGLRFRDTS